LLRYSEVRNDLYSMLAFGLASAVARSWRRPGPAQ